MSDGQQLQPALDFSNATFRSHILRFQQHSFVTTQYTFPQHQQHQFCTVSISMVMQSNLKIMVKDVRQHSA